jgi:hypothetical protein
MSTGGPESCRFAHVSGSCNQRPIQRAASESSVGFCASELYALQLQGCGFPFFPSRTGLMRRMFPYRRLAIAIPFYITRLQQNLYL